MKPLKWIFMFFSFAVFSACITDVELNTGNTSREYTLNCILNTGADTITATITKTKNIVSAGNSFEAVNDAEIILFENNIDTGKFLFHDSGKYYLLFNPKPGATYRLEAKIKNKVIWAETTVPDVVDVHFEKLASSMLGYQLSFKNKYNTDDFYWITATGYINTADTIRNDSVVFHLRKNIADALLSDFEYADDFNRYYNELGIYKFEYDYYMRLTGRHLPQEVIKVKFRPIVGASPELFFISADYHLDKYMKSSLLMRENDLYAEEMPISYSPFPVYSNINGGTGIFGSYTGVSKEFSK